jgi:hypothetical protein
MFQAFFLSLSGVRPKYSGGEWSFTEQPSGDGLLISAPVAAFLGALLGCLTTSYVSELGIAPAIASALATMLLCGWVLVIRATRCLPDQLFTAIYGGTFGGMTSVHWFSNNTSDPSFLQLNILLTSLAIICGLAFCIVAAFDGRTNRPFACGYGGRSGAIAAAACLVFVELASLAGADDRLFRAARADVLGAAATPAALTFVACLMGTFAVLLPLRAQGLKSATAADRVFLSATIALIGLISLHLSGLGDAAALDAFYAGCFLGMSTPERMKGRTEAVLAAVVLAALLVQVKRLLPGVGGSLGLATFLTVAVFVALNRVSGSIAQAFLDRKGVSNMRPQSFTNREVTVGVRAFESQPSSPARRRGRVTFNVVLASVALGCFVLPVLLARDGLGLGMAALTQVAGEPALIPEPPVSSETAAKPGDDTSPSILPSLEADKADSRVTENFSVADRGVDRQADIKDRPDAATPVTAEAVPPPIPQAALSDVPAGVQESKQSNVKIFREFLQWRAAHSSEIAVPGQKPIKKKRIHAAQVVGPLAVAASPASPGALTPRPRAIRPHRIVPASGSETTEPSSRPMNPRAP